MRSTLIVGFLLSALVAAGLYLSLRPQPPVEPAARLADILPQATDTAGFARALEPGGLSFPEAFGAHPDYQTEWWYYTGNVQGAEGRPFGYQLTIFRRALVPGDPQRPSSLASNSIYMAHFNLTDAQANRFYSAERFQRAGAAANATAQPYEVWLDDWQVREVEPGLYQMQAKSEAVAIDFMLTALKEPVLHGDRGLSQKSSEAGNASYYYSQTRLETRGTLTVQGNAYEVAGTSWKDHEYSTSALGEGIAGWDWFALQLSDGRELMYYQLRRADGSVEGTTSGTLILADGASRHLPREAVAIEVLESWRSPATGGLYPAAWRLRVPTEQLDLTVNPLINDQEVRLSTTYWEGAVTVTGSAAGAPVTGQGYVELTGYAGEAVPLH